VLAEANQWPADVRAYLGNGDEFHMAFHFPSDARMFMDRQSWSEDRKPIIEILEQNPQIPDHVPVVHLLRIHDELTLEMVTDIERRLYVRRVCGR